MAGILEAEDPGASDAERRHAVPAGHDEVLLDGDSLNHMAPMAQLVVACALPIHAVLEAFRTGDGVPYADYGADLHEGQARFTRPLFDTLLATEWLPAVPAIHDRLDRDPPASVAALACGLGRSSIPIARGDRRRPGHGHARGRGARVRRAGRMRRLRGRADRERLLAVLPAHAVTAARYAA